MLEIRNPYTKDLLATIEMSDEKNSLEIFTRALTAWKNRKNFPKKDRIKVLKTFKSLVEKNHRDIALKATKEGGKPLKDSLIEVERALSGIDCTISALYELKGQQVPMAMNEASDKHIAYTRREPKGVVLAISAFNHPFNLLIHQVLPAIAVGCPVVVKPSLSTPLSAIMFQELLQSAGLPDGWCQVLICEDTLTEKLAASDNISFLSFIGSQSIGWKLKSQLAPGVSCNLEHGGTASAIIDQSANLEDASRQLVRSSFYHSGQVCVSTQNIFIHESVREEFTKLFLNEARNLKVGNPELLTTDLGPIIKKTAFNRIIGLIEDARKSDAKILLGGNALSPTTIEATVIDSPHDIKSEIYQEEIFGPLVNFFSYDCLDTLIATINESKILFPSEFL